MKTRIPIILTLIASVAFCSCILEPRTNKLTHEADIIATVGFKTEGQIATEYNNNGSYTGVSKSSTYGSVYYNYSGASATVDCSDFGLGTIPVSLSGQVKITYENYPDMYPLSWTYNLSYTYLNKQHTLECKTRSTGVSSTTTLLLKIDGIEYDPD